MSLGLTVLAVAFAVLALARVPIAYALFGAGAAYLLVTRQDPGLLLDQTVNTFVSLSVLLAVPMFTLAANVMNAAGITDRLWAAAEAVVGRVRGGTAHVTILVSVVFSGISGSAVSDAAGPGMLAVRAMRKAGYPDGFAAALVAASATIAPIIPPSIPMIIYALLSGTSVAALFLGGVVPGFLMAGSLMAITAIMARRKGLPRGAAVALRDMPRVMGRATLPATLPLVLLGGMFAGFFTPTEAASVAALWALLMGVLAFRAPLPALGGAFAETARQTAVVMLLIAGAFIVNYAIARDEVAQGIAAWFLDRNFSPLLFLLAVNALFLVLGCFLDGAVMLLVFIPVLLPAARAVGVDPVHFGVVCIVNFMIGLITPPYGLLLFVLSALSGIPLAAIIRAIWPFVVALILALLAMVLEPRIVLWLPHAAGYV